MEHTTKIRQFCGRQFTPEETELVREVVSTCGGISRQELAYTVCELLDWKRANGKLKERECRDFLEHLGQLGLLQLPAKKPTGSCAPRKRISKKGPAWPYSGRGRMDRCRLRHGADVKTVLVYPLIKSAARRLISGR